MSRAIRTTAFSRFRTRALLTALATAAMAGTYVGLIDDASSAEAEAEGSTARPIVIGHRGASALRPEHTLSSYRTAIAHGADFIEPDVVPTKDGVLVTRHDNWLADTTDVEQHQEFAHLKKTKTIDGVTRTDWFTEDFTLAELRTLRTEERVPTLRPENTTFNRMEPVPTLDEVLALARAKNVGVYPETKHPGYFDGLGLSMEEGLLRSLERYGFDSARDKVFIQSFETANLRELSRKTRIRLIQLIGGSGAPYDFVAAGDKRTYSDLVTKEGLKWVASYADGIGPSLTRIVPVDATGRLGKPTTLVRDAHQRWLDVHPYTVRPENAELPADFRQGDPTAPNYNRTTGDVAGWLAKIYRLGVDGVFTDDPASAVGARAEVFDL